MATDRIELALDAGNWRVLKMLLQDRGWRKEDIIPEIIATAAGDRQRDSRYDIPLPLPGDDGVGE